MHCIPVILGAQDKYFVNKFLNATRHFNVWLIECIKNLLVKVEISRNERKNIIKGLILLKDNKFATEILVGLSVGCRLSYKDRRIAIDIIHGINPEREPDEDQLVIVEKLKALVPDYERGKFIDEMIYKGQQFPWTNNQKLTVEKIIKKTIA